jgi:hypothetical protein
MRGGAISGCRRSMKSVFKHIVRGLGGLAGSHTLRTVGGVMLAAVAAKVALDGYEAIKKRVAEQPDSEPVAPPAEA